MEQQRGAGRRRGRATAATRARTAPRPAASPPQPGRRRPNVPSDARHQRHRDQHDRVERAPAARSPRARARPAASARRRRRSRGASSSASAQKCGGVHSSTITNRNSAPRPSAPVRGRPPGQRRDRAGRAADHDVLGGRALQPQRVDEHVERAAAEREHRREQVREHRQHRERQRRAARARTRPRARGEIRPAATGRDAVRGPIRRSMSRSSTWFSALAPPHASAPPSTSAASGSSAGAPPARGDHRAHRGQHQQRHDPRLGQRHVVAPARPSRAARLGSARRERRAPSAMSDDGHAAMPARSGASVRRSCATNRGANGYR